MPYLTTHYFRYRIVIWNIILMCLGVYGEIEVVALHLKTIGTHHKRQSLYRKDMPSMSGNSRKQQYLLLYRGQRSEIVNSKNHIKVLGI